MRFAEVTLGGPAELTGFYRDVLGLPLDGDAIAIGETTLRLAPSEGAPFYHVALLVPGDRFDAAHAWIRGAVELLGDVFPSDAWNSRAVYFHDPAGNILELIAHHGLAENGRSGDFVAEELVGFSEVGLVGDRSLLLGRLEAIGLQLWDGELDEPNRIAFVGEKGRTFILAPPGRGWAPTGRPAEPYPVVATLAGLGNGVDLVTVCYLLDPETIEAEKQPPGAASNSLLLG
jgi:catechol 2,3-dioxygenase-like lactoylglutathione lyase family enzyme